VRTSSSSSRSLGTRCSPKSAKSIWLRYSLMTKANGWCFKHTSHSSRLQRTCRLRLPQRFKEQRSSTTSKSGPPARESPTHDSQSKAVQTMKSPLSAATTLWIASLIAITASAQEARGPGVRRSRRGRAGLRPEQETAKCDVHSV